MTGSSAWGIPGIDFLELVIEFSRVAQYKITREKYKLYRLGGNILKCSCDRGLISRIYRGLPKLNSKKQTIQLENKKWHEQAFF